MAEEKPDGPVENPEEKPLSRIPPPGRWADVMDEVMEEAMRSGAFDNLPGRGKPLKLNNNPHAPGTDLAYQLLKDNDYTLPWISERKEVIAAINALCDDIYLVWDATVPNSGLPIATRCVWPSLWIGLSARKRGRSASRRLIAASPTST